MLRLLLCQLAEIQCLHKIFITLIPHFVIPLSICLSCWLGLSLFICLCITVCLSVYLRVCVSERAGSGHRLEPSWACDPGLGGLSVSTLWHTHTGTRTHTQAHTHIFTLQKLLMIIMSPCRRKNRLRRRERNSYRGRGTTRHIWCVSGKDR